LICSIVPSPDLLILRFLETSNGHLPIEEDVTSTASEAPKADPDAPLVGPSLGPAGPPETYVPEDMAYEEEAPEGPPQSPYSENRARIRDLTLPSVPNLDMPPSPPGSPSQSSNKKFAHFLELKKQGVHFNEKLAKSSALKNPSLMQKLMDFAGISEEEQYSNTLPKEAWDPAKFPVSAYKEELAKIQQKILRLREDAKIRGQRESVEFVSASNGSGKSGIQGTGGIAGRSAAERVMAELERGRSNSPQVAGVKRKTRFES
jgi:hypothetical protein